MASGETNGEQVKERLPSIREKIAVVLSDGQPHAYEELYTCFDDELVEKANLSKHICDMRAQLRSLGQDIDCVVFNRRYYYRQVRFLLDGPTPPITLRRKASGFMATLPSRNAPPTDI